jgi:hypothetical protein
VPAYLKIIICVVVAIVAAIAYLAEINAREAALAVAVLMIAAIWLFPEARGGKGSTD